MDVSHDTPDVTTKPNCYDLTDMLVLVRCFTRARNSQTDTICFDSRPNQGGHDSRMCQIESVTHLGVISDALRAQWEPVPAASGGIGAASEGPGLSNMTKTPPQTSSQCMSYLITEISSQHIPRQTPSPAQIRTTSLHDSASHDRCCDAQQLDIYTCQVQTWKTMQSRHADSKLHACSTCIAPHLPPDMSVLRSGTIVRILGARGGKVDLRRSSGLRRMPYTILYYDIIIY